MRNLFITVIVLVAAVVFGMFFWSKGEIPGLPNTAAVATTPVTFVPIVSGSSSSITRRANFLITSQDELGELWTMIDAQNAPPTVDFSHQSVIAVFAGQEPTGGYSISVSNVGDSMNAREVTVAITKPGISCGVSQQQTAPYQIVEIPATSLPLKHQDDVSTNSCIH